MKLPENFRPRVIMTVSGVLLMSAAVALYKHSGFGVDPFQCFAMGTWGKIAPGIAYGTYYALLSLVMLAVDFFLDKHYIGIATFINMFLTGYIVSWTKSGLEALLPNPSLPVRILLLVSGIVVVCLASALYMTSDLGVSVYDAIPIVISNRSGKPFRWVRVSADCICVLIGTLCGMMPGLATVITAFFMGPLVDFFNRKVAEPLLRRFSK